MRALLAGLAFASIALFGTASLAAGCHKLLESDVKIAAMRSYADLLALAARNGWDYAPEATDAGARRHFEEMKAHLVASGYEIVPVGSARYCVASRTAAAK